MPVRTDARVRKEAESLAAAGYKVTVSCNRRKGTTNETLNDVRYKRMPFARGLHLDLWWKIFRRHLSRDPVVRFFLFLGALALLAGLAIVGVLAFLGARWGLERLSLEWAAAIIALVCVGALVAIPALRLRRRLRRHVPRSPAVHTEHEGQTSTQEPPARPLQGHQCGAELRLHRASAHPECKRKPARLRRRSCA